MKININNNRLFSRFLDQVRSNNYSRISRKDAKTQSFIVTDYQNLILQGVRLMTIVSLASYYISLPLKAMAQPSNNLITQNTREEKLTETYKLDEEAKELSQQGKFSEVIPLRKKALAIRREILGNKHPETAHSLNYLARAYESQGNYEEAEILYKKAIAIQREISGNKDFYTALFLTNFASFYQNQGNYEEAEPLYQEALAILQEKSGEEHAMSILVLIGLGALYYQWGYYEKAEPLLKEALVIGREVLGDEHNLIVKFVENILEIIVQETKK